MFSTKSPYKTPFRPKVAIVAAALNSCWRCQQTVGEGHFAVGGKPITVVTPRGFRRIVEFTCAGGK